MLSNTQQLTTSLDHCTHHTLHTCTCVTRPLATNIHISDFRIAIQLTCSQHILHRYIHSHATHVFIAWVQEICKLFHISRTVSIGINGLVEVVTPLLLQLFLCVLRRKGKGKGRRGEEGGVIRHVASKLAVVLMQQG